MELENRLTINQYIAAESDSDESQNNDPSKADSNFNESDDCSKTPQEKANIISKLTFYWLSSMFKTGYKRPLQIEDLNYLMNQCKAGNTLKTFYKHWNKYKEIDNNNNNNNNNNNSNNNMEQPLMIDIEIKENNEEKEKEKEKEKLPKLWKAILTAFGRPWFCAAPLKVIALTKPFINVTIMAAYLNAAQDLKNGKEFLEKGLIYSLCIFLNNMIGSLVGTQYDLKCRITSMNTKSAIICACYDKILSLTNTSRQNTTSGQIMTLITVDVGKIAWIFWGIWDLLLAPIEAIICIYLLYKCIGWSILISVIIICITISPIKSFTVKIAKKYQKKIMNVRDNRMKIINEVCKAIKVIKMYGWISSLSDKVSNVRFDEVRIFRNLQCLWKSMWFYWELVPILLAVISLSIFTSIGGILSVEKAFVSLALFYQLRNPIQRIPGIILGLIDANVSLQRVTKFLISNEIKRDTIQYYYNHNNNDTENNNNNSMISCLNTSFSWDDNGKIIALNNLNIEFKQGTITMIIGETGSGKSALLYGLLGNLNKINGSIYYNNKDIKIGYSSQTAWIQNATIKENILFGKKYDKQLYDKVIKICALKNDLKILSAGDLTEIGEKGINLSGGQKQRLSLARAIYSNNDIYLFDDPLSAVDIHVANYIFNQCIQNYLIKQKIKQLFLQHMQYHF